MKKNGDFAYYFLRKHLMRDILNILEVVIVLTFLIKLFNRLMDQFLFRRVICAAKFVPLPAFDRRNKL